MIRNCQKKRKKEKAHEAKALSFSFMVAVFYIAVFR